MMPEGLVKCADPGLRRLPPLLTPFLPSGSRSRCTRASFPSFVHKWRARCAFRPWKHVHALLTRIARSQIKVRDFSRAQVTLQPAEYASWSEARSELMVEAKKPHKLQFQAELAASPDEATSEEVSSHPCCNAIFLVFVLTLLDACADQGRVGEPREGH